VFRLGIAGWGWAGERHHDAAAADDRTAVTAVADADPDRLAHRTGNWDVEALDGVVVALPHHLREDAAVGAAERGPDVLCEKPIARTVIEADAMLETIARAGIVLVVAESARYEPWTRRVEEAIADGAVGTPAFGSYSWLHDFDRYRYDRAAGLNDVERLGGGHWLITGVHVVSRLRG